MILYKWHSGWMAATLNAKILDDDWSSAFLPSGKFQRQNHATRDVYSYCFKNCVLMSPVIAVLANEYQTSLHLHRWFLYFKDNSNRFPRALLLAPLPLLSPGWGWIGVGDATRHTQSLAHPTTSRNEPPHRSRSRPDRAPARRWPSRRSEPGSGRWARRARRPSRCDTGRRGPTGGPPGGDTRRRRRPSPRPRSRSRSAGPVCTARRYCNASGTGEIYWN